MLDLQTIKKVMSSVDNHIENKFLKWIFNHSFLLKYSKDEEFIFEIIIFFCVTVFMLFLILFNFKITEY